MKKIFLAVTIFLTINIFSSAEKISIAISSPFLRNENSETIFFQKHFIFEFFYAYTEEKYSLEVLNTPQETEELEYFSKIKDSTVKNNYDYLLNSIVYSNKNYLFFKVNLIDPYNNDIIFSQLFISKNDYTLSDSLSEISLNIVSIINKMQLKDNVLAGKSLEKKNIREKNLDTFIPRYRHEIFVLSSFIKNHASISSMLEFQTGYNFAPFNFFSVEAGLFWGGGNANKYFNLDKYNNNHFNIGNYCAAYFFLPYIVEPSIGLRIELNLVVTSLDDSLLNSLHFSLPIDLGIKFYLTPKDMIRINSSFQFTSLNMTNRSSKYEWAPFWENDYIIGIMIGYARKI